MSEVFTEFPSREGYVPYVNTKRIKEIPHTVIEKYGETDFKSIFQRNFEREYLAKQAALLSVTGQCLPIQPTTTLDVSITANPTGGVEVEYPVEASAGDTAEIQHMKDKPTKLYRLNRADVKYTITPESQIVGYTDLIQSEFMLEANEQLNARVDNLTLTSLNSIAYSDNAVAATDTWNDSDAKPDKDIAQAIGNIITNSSIDPNMVEGQGSRWTVILPIKVYPHLNNLRVIDGTKQTIRDYITTKYSLNLLFSRAPFGTTNWPLVNDALVIPTKDRKVGKFRTFDGAGRVPSMYTHQDPKGLEVTMQYWMNFIPAPDEADGSFTTNRRVAKITGIAS